MSKNYVLNTYNKFIKLPFGKKLFSWYSARRAPYFGTVSPIITDIKPNFCEVHINIAGDHIYGIFLRTLLFEKDQLQPVGSVNYLQTMYDKSAHIYRRRFGFDILAALKP